MNEQQRLRLDDFQNLLKSLDSNLNHQLLDCLTAISTAVENNDQTAYQFNVSLFDEQYEKLNLEQKAAVETWIGENN